MSTTFKQNSDFRRIFLNKLEILKKNKIIACNSSWMMDGRTKCELYNKSNHKRIIVHTDILFMNQDFLSNPDGYLEMKDWFRKLL
jgi:hypothetical protein